LKLLCGYFHPIDASRDSTDWANLHKKTVFSFLGGRTAAPPIDDDELPPPPNTPPPPLLGLADDAAAAYDE